MNSTLTRLSSELAKELVTFFPLEEEHNARFASRRRYFGMLSSLDPDEFSAAFRIADQDDFLFAVTSQIAKRFGVPHLLELAVSLQKFVTSKKLDRLVVELQSLASPDSRFVTHRDKTEEMDMDIGPPMRVNVGPSASQAVNCDDNSSEMDTMEKSQALSPASVDTKISSYLGPAALIDAARQAHPAFKWAILVGGLLGVVASALQFGPSPASLVFGAVVMVVLMVLFLVFSQATKLSLAFMALPAKILVWFFLLVVLATSGLLFSSAFFDVPLPFRSYIVRLLDGDPVPVTSLSEFSFPISSTTISPQLGPYGPYQPDFLDPNKKPLCNLRGHLTPKVEQDSSGTFELVVYCDIGAVDVDDGKDTGMAQANTGEKAQRIKIGSLSDSTVAKIEFTSDQAVSFNKMVKWLDVDNTLEVGKGVLKSINFNPHSREISLQISSEIPARKVKRNTVEK